MSDVSLMGWWHTVAASRAPDFVIGGAEPYLRRWWVAPRNPVQNVYLHHFLRSDDDRALHSHPWAWNASLLLEGSYLEHLPDGQKVRRQAGDLIQRRGEAWHRVELTDGPCWTLFLTGENVREWGFDCGGRFVHWRDFCGVTPDGKNDGTVGKGCAA